MLRIAACACALGVTLGSTPLNAAVVNTQKSTRDTLNTTFDIGAGNPNTDFGITRIQEDMDNNGDIDNTVEIGVKAKQRFFGQQNVGGSGSTYVVQPGLSPSSVSDSTPDQDRAWWNFDFSVDLGSRRLGDSSVEMVIVDPENDMYTLDFGDDASVGLIQSSWNIGFGFINDATFNGSPLGTGGLGGFQPDLRGRYDITFSVSDRTTGELGSQSITAQVPVPASLPLLAGSLFLLGLFRLQRANLIKGLG